LRDEYPAVGREPHGGREIQMLEQRREIEAVRQIGRRGPAQPKKDCNGGQKSASNRVGHGCLPAEGFRGSRNSFSIGSVQASSTGGIKSRWYSASAWAKKAA